MVSNCKKSNRNGRRMDVINLHYEDDRFIDGVKLGIPHDKLEEIHVSQRKYIVGSETRAKARRLQAIMDTIQ